MTNILTRQPLNTADGGQALMDWLAEARTAHRALRDEATGQVHVFSYAGSQRILTDPVTFSSNFEGIFPAPVDGPNFLNSHLGVTDPPRHGKLRRLVSQAFTAKSVRELGPRITEMTEQLLDAAEAKDEVDLVEALFKPLPVAVIAEMLGVPAADQEQFMAWAEAIMMANDGMATGDPEIMVLREKMTDPLNEMQDYILGHIHERRVRPGDDLISRLATAEVEGERLTESELFLIPIVMLLAGHISTTLSLGNTLLVLNEHADARTAVRNDHALLDATFEEALRIRPPVASTFRLATAPVTIDDVHVPAGAMMVVWVLSANYDDQKFPDPTVFSLERGANPHLTFGHGPHFCLGAQLARLEARIALSVLLSRYPALRITAEPSFSSSPIAFGVTKLVVSTRK